MMISILFLFVIFSLNPLINDSAIIKSIYFDPATSITANNKDGVVILELVNGTKSTICMTSVYDNFNAQVVCKMMQYTGGSVVTSYAVVSALVSTIGSTLFQNISCAGNENTLENCPNFQMGGNNFLCNNHNQDLHVYCNGDYTFTKTILTISNCSGSLSNGTEGLLSVPNSGVASYFCGVNGNFGLKEAIYFCQYYLCSNNINARIVQGYQSGIRVIGGFNNMSCSLTGCVNIYPYQSDRCTPDTNVAVICTNDTATSYVAPSISCSTTAVTVSWNLTVFSTTTLANNYFAMKYANGSNCTSVSTGATVSQNVNLVANYSTCDMNVTGDLDNITFTFQAIRMYPKNNNIITYPDENFNVSCVITRNRTVTEGPLQINPVALPPSSGNTNIPNTLTLYSDNLFRNQIANLGTVAIGSRVFALVVVTNPPPNIILVIDRCYYGEPAVNLILNRCAARSDVQITPVNNVEKSFSFLVTQMLGFQQAALTCLTSMCSTTETNCLSSC